MTNSQEIWQIKVEGNIYEANFDELKVWIADGNLQRTDLVSRDGLRWLEAGKMPWLASFFNVKEGKIPIPKPEPISQPLPKPQPRKDVGDKRVCTLHPDIEAAFVCKDCWKVFCKTCPNSYGGTTKVCHLCGGLCEDIKLVKNQIIKDETFQQAQSEGFGLQDFLRALAYPFKFRFSLLCGTLIFCGLAFLQLSGNVGGRLFQAAALIIWMLSTILTFGIFTNVIEKMLVGKTGRDFMPTFDEFELWDDGVWAWFLNIGVFLSSFWLFGVLCFVVFVFQIRDEKLAQNGYPNGSVVRTMEKFFGIPTESEQYQIIKQKIILKQNEMLEQYRAENPNATWAEASEYVRHIQATTDEDRDKLKDLLKPVGEKNFEAIKSVFTLDFEATESFRKVYPRISEAGPGWLFLGVITLFLGFFYLPAAWIVAAYTRYLDSTLNPMIGLDTIKRLGSSYLIILFCGGVLFICTLLIDKGLSIAFAPMNLRDLGNIPAVVIGAVFKFYFSVAFSVLVGNALYKKSDLFKLTRN